MQSSLSSALRPFLPSLPMPRLNLAPVSKVIGRETVQYVSNIYKYYIAYRMITEQEEGKSKMMKKGDQS